VSGQITCLRWSRIAGRLLRRAWKSVLATRGTVAKRFRRDHFLLDEGSANTRRRPEVTRANTFGGLHWYKREFVSARGAGRFHGNGARIRDLGVPKLVSVSLLARASARASYFGSFLDGFWAYVMCQYEISRSIVHGMPFDPGYTGPNRNSPWLQSPAENKIALVFPSSFFPFLVSSSFFFLRCIELSLPCFNFVSSVHDIYRNGGWERVARARARAKVGNDILSTKLRWMLSFFFIKSLSPIPSVL